MPKYCNQPFFALAIYYCRQFIVRIWTLCPNVYFPDLYYTMPPNLSDHLHCGIEGRSAYISTEVALFVATVSKLYKTNFICLDGLSELLHFQHSLHLTKTDASTKSSVCDHLDQFSSVHSLRGLIKGTFVCLHFCSCTCIFPLSFIWLTLMVFCLPTLLL